jgi:HEAT repeat protein
MDLSSLTSSNWQERRQVLDSLVHYGAERLSEALLDLVRNQPQDLTSLNAALQLLHLLDAPVVPGLVNLLHDDNPEIQAYAALILGQVKDKRKRQVIISALLRVLEESVNKENAVNLRFNIIEALGNHNAGEAVEPLLKVLEEDNFFLSYAAIHSLGEIGERRVQPHLIKMLWNEMLDTAAVTALGNTADLSAVEAIGEWLNSPQGDAAVAAQALGGVLRKNIPLDTNTGSCHENLVDVGQRLLSVLTPAGLEKLVHSVPGIDPSDLPLENARHLPDLALVIGALAAAVKTSQINTIEEFEPDHLFSALVRLLKNPDAHRAAAAALARIGKPALPWLVEVLHPLSAINAEETDDLYRREAAFALGEIRDLEAVPSLIAALSADDPEVAMAAAESLGKIGGEQAVGALLAQFNHPSAGVRKAVVHALQKMKNLVNYKDVARRLESPDPLIKETAIHLLANSPAIVKEDQVIVALILESLADANPMVRRAAVEALPNFEDAQIPSALSDAIQNGDPDIRAAAARSLGSCNPQFALPLLYEALHDTNPWVKLYSCRSIGEFGQAESFQKIVPLLKDPMPPVRAAAVEALGKIGGQGAISHLQNLLLDEEPEVQRAAGDLLELLLENVERG